MKKLFCSLLLLVPAILFAQQQDVNLRVRVQNEKSEGIVSPTVTVMRMSDSVRVNGVQAGNQINFTVRANNSYSVEASSVGYASSVVYVRLRAKDSLVTVKLKPSVSDLNTVVVTARKPLITQDDDKTIVDAEQLAASSSNAFEVLEKTPGTITDQDGNVYLNSQTPALIFINGREVKLGASDLASLLKSLPASSVQKLEILRNPSAKYDAAGSGGIVNIVLKKGVKLGTNGSAELSYFQGRFNTKSASFNINRSSGPLNLYLNYNYTDRRNYDQLGSKRLLRADTFFFQNAYTKFHTTNNFVGFGFDREMSKAFNLSYDGRVSANVNRSDAANNIDIRSEQTNFPKGKNISTIDNRSPSLYFANALTGKLKLDSIGSDLTSVAEYNYFSGRPDQSYVNYYLLPYRRPLSGTGNIRNAREFVVLKSDLTKKLKAGYTIESGFKLTLSSSSNNALYISDTGTVKYVDQFQTNKFKYRENIGALYFQASKKFGRLTVKPGVRYEYTNLRGTQIIPTSSEFQIKRSDLFPYLFLKHKLFSMMGFDLMGNLIYRRSITRPYYEALNPFPKFVDQYTFDVGNPGLQPQFTNNYEFNIQADDFPVVTAGLNDVKNIFSNLTYQRNDTLFRTFDNLGRNKEYYIRLAGGIPPGGKYFFYAGTQINMMNYTGRYNGFPFKFKNTSWNFFMFHNYRPVSSLVLTANGFLRVNGVFNFFRISNFGQLNLSANKALLKKKMNLVLSVNDIFRTNRNSFDVQVPAFTATGSRYSDTRRFGITLRYNFGFKPKEDKQDFTQPEESTP